MSIELPSGWISAKFDEVVDVLDFEREPINSSERAQRVEGKNSSALFPYYGATGQVGWIDGYRSDGERILLGEDAAPFLDPIKDKAYLANGRFWVNNHAHVLRGAVGLVNNRYLCYQLNNVDYHPFVSGSTRLKLTSAAMKQIPMFIAPAAEQTRIVEKLEELLTDLDVGVAELKAAQKKLGQYRQSLLKAAVEGSLTAEWRAARKSVRPELVERRSTLTSSSDHPSTGSGRTDEEETGEQLLQRILIERRTSWEAKQLAKFAEQGKTPPKDWQKKYPEPVQLDTNELPELPEGWVWASVEQLGHVQLGRQRSPSKVGKANPTPYIRAANITEDGVDLSDVLEMDFSETEKETFALKVGDVLLTEASGSPEHVGRPAIWKRAAGLYCFQNTVLRFSPEGIGSEYAFYSFLAMQKLGVFGKLSGGVGINHLSAGKFSKLPVPLPPTDEQIALIEIIKGRFSLCDEQLISNTHSLKQSAAQRKNILKAAFSGQLVPQDPNDEPASLLLERIRTERAAQDTNNKSKKRKAKHA